MLDFYFQLPLVLSGLLVLGACAGVCVGGHWLVRRLMPRAAGQETELAVALMAVVAAFIGIMLAFAAFQVWQDYNDADTAVAREASSISQLYRDLTTYGEASEAARADVKLYLKKVMESEWPLLAKGQAGPEAVAALIQTYRDVGKIEPKTPRETVVYAEIFKKLNEVVEHRRMRIIAAGNALPPLFWVVVLAGSGVIVGFTFVFPSTPANALMIAGLGVSLGLIFMFILDVDHPFSGPYAVTPAELATLPPLFAQIDGPPAKAP
jgi:hypothetical protein